MPDTARHYIIGGAQSASDGGVSTTSPLYWLSEISEGASKTAYPYIAVAPDGGLEVLAGDDTLFSPVWSAGAPLDAWPDFGSDDNFAVWIIPDTSLQFGTHTEPFGTNSQSALTSTLALIDQIQTAMPGAPVVIFEDWADPARFLLDGRITDATRPLYFNYVTGDYHLWFTSLVSDVQAARPDVDITLVPAASTVAELAVGPGFGDLATTLMPDTVEDGAAARAFVTGAVGFATSFDMELPASSPLAERADPALAAVYPALSTALTMAFVTDPGDITDPVPTPTVVTGTDGDDVLALTEALERADLGAGLDTVQVATTRADTNVIFAGDGSILVQLPGDGSPAVLQNVERLQFQDGTLALDIDGIAGQAYRLYQAAFDRTPDPEGLGFWITALQGGGVDLAKAAEYFMLSEEFEAAYGSPDAVTDVLYLTLLYVNALDRPPDDDGFVFWRDQQDQGVTRAEMMVYFSESVENTAQVAPDIADGIWYF